MESNHSSEEELDEIIRAEPAKQSLPSDNRHRTQNESERLELFRVRFYTKLVN